MPLPQRTWTDPDRPKLLRFPFWQSNFVKLFIGGLQYKFIRTFLNYFFQNIYQIFHWFRCFVKEISRENDIWILLFDFHTYLTVLNDDRLLFVCSIHIFHLFLFIQISISFKRLLQRSRCLKEGFFSITIQLWVSDYILNLRH